MPSRFVWITHVSDVFELKMKKWQTGTGPDAVFNTGSRGWFIRLGEGENTIALHLGEEQPQIVKGQKVRLIVEVD